MSKTKKKKFTGAKAVSRQCRNNGSCPYCRKNRLYKHLKRILGYEQTRRSNNTE